MIDAALKHAAPVTVSSNGDAIVTDGSEDELRIRRLQVVKAFLDDMIAVQILNKGHHLERERADDGGDLLWSVDEFDHLLKSAGSVLVQRDGDHLRGCVLDEHRALVIIGILEKLLAKVIAKRIYQSVRVTASKTPSKLQTHLSLAPPRHPWSPRR
jgi:hypothetical protein